MYELRRRGYDVQAKAAPQNRASDVAAYGTECFTDKAGKPVSFDWSNRLTRSELEAALALAPNGARYMIYVKWDDRHAHVYNAEKLLNMTLYIDAQNPDAKAMKYLSQGINGEFAIIRTDDKLITTDSRILSAIMEATP